MMLSVVGFMVKLPRAFHHFDKELHAGFYLFCFVFFAVLFQKKIFQIALGLAFFGIMIELAHEYSNKVAIKLHQRPIHGRFDIEDIKFNIIGLAIGMILFLFFKLFNFNKNDQ